MAQLLDKWNAEVDLYPEIVVTDMDGNVRTTQSDEPIRIRVWLSVMNQSGTASRRAEQDNEGFETEKVLRMRPCRQDQDIPIEAQSQIVWNGDRYSVFGDVSLYMGGPRTAHKVYTLRRS